MNEVDYNFQKKKIRLIIVSKRRRQQKEKENANTKITFQGEKGLFHIRMENMNQLINKSKIDKAVKSVINNIPSNLSYDKNRNRVYISLDDKNDNKKRVKKNDINIINEDYNFYDIYLEKKIPKKIDGQNNINNNNMKNEKDKNTNFEMKNYLRESKRGFLNDDKKNNNQDIYIFKKINNNILNKSDKKNNKLISRNDGKDLIFNQGTENVNSNNKGTINDENYNLKLFQYNNKNTSIRTLKITNVQKNICSICDCKYSYFFVAKCNIHFLCKKCAKFYYEEKIENGAKKLYCPFIKCGSEFPIKDAINFLSKSHYNLLNNDENEMTEEKKNFTSLIKIKSPNNFNEINNYSGKNILDINNNKLFYNYNKNKKIFCSNCDKDTLFSRDNVLFLKCLNCGFSQCKHCFKQYTNDHFDMNSINYCRIFYRNDDFINIKKKKIIEFLIQLFLVFAIFFITILSCFIKPKNFFTNFFGIKYNRKYKYIKMFFIYLFSFIIFIISLPFLIFLYPWFPSILAFSDY